MNLQILKRCFFYESREMKYPTINDEMFNSKKYDPLKASLKRFVKFEFLYNQDYQKYMSVITMVRYHKIMDMAVFLQKSENLIRDRDKCQPKK